MDEKPKLILVDDEKAITNSIRRLLFEDDIDIVVFNDPVKAKEYITTESYDILITDYKMPEIRGIELLKLSKMHNLNAFRIMMTGFADIDIAINAINEGSIYKYVSKPWNNNKFRDMINEIIKLKKKEDIKNRIIDRVLYKNSEWSQFVTETAIDYETINEKSLNVLDGLLLRKDKDLYDHSFRVKSTAVGFAKYLNLPVLSMKAIALAAKYHDIGKLAIKDNITYKDDKLSQSEFNEMKFHPIVGFEIINQLDFMHDISKIILMHHERIDGNGYPKGLIGDEILFEAKLLSICDFYDALISKRIYKESVSKNEVLEMILKEADSRFDQTLAKAFVDMLRRKS